MLTNVEQLSRLLVRAEQSGQLFYKQGPAHVQSKTISEIVITGRAHADGSRFSAIFPWSRKVVGLRISHLARGLCSAEGLPPRPQAPLHGAGMIRDKGQVVPHCALSGREG